MNIIDKFLNSITMYRLVLYGLTALALISVVFGFTGVLSFSGFDLIISAVILLVVCHVVNLILAKIFKVSANVESSSITALILFFLLYPGLDLTSIGTMVIAAVLAMLSKYILKIKRKHIFNPVAIAAVILDLSGSGLVIWWVGSRVLLPFTLILGLMIVRKLRRFTLFLSFVAVSLTVMMLYGLSANENLVDVLTLAFISWPLIFLGTVMLTEPLTTPPGKKLQMIYGALVGLFFTLQFKFGPVYPTPELALVIGNIFSFLVSSKQRLILSLQQKIELAPNIYEFTFRPDQKLLFAAGQYLEWTLGHPKSDSRGIRRYFTVASSPTEDTIKLTIRTSEKSSSFKKKLLEMRPNEQLTVSSLGGEFTLPHDQKQKMVFIAGGIGLTPFVSMIQYLIDIKQPRDIVLFYACANAQDFVYRDLFKKAEKEMGLKIVYVCTGNQNIPQNWEGRTGYITQEIVTEEVSDFKERKFYISGPDAMVQSYKKLLRALKISPHQIVTDYFPGF